MPMREDVKAEEEKRKKRNSKAMRSSNRFKQLADVRIPDVVTPSNASRSPSKAGADVGD